MKSSISRSAASLFTTRKRTPTRSPPPNFKNGGREWQPKGEPDLVDVHDFPFDAVGKAIPYGVYDLAANEGFVSVGVDHDTPVVAVRSIEA